MSGAPLAITLGDPGGIGPEVMVRALAERLQAGDAVSALLVGSAEAAGRAQRILGMRHGARVLEPQGDGPVELRAIRWAVQACREGRACAMVTGPIHKARMAAAGFEYPGHTEYLAHLCGVERPVMAFVGGVLRVALVTVHLPLRQVPDALSTDAVLHTLRSAQAALVQQLGIGSPRLVVCGLNPHAGDGGLLGSEEAEIIEPALRAARAEGLNAVGPMSAEAAFLSARRGRADLVVAMYHDQGLAPLKAVDFGRCVNWTLGLPILRTSVDHGTADDIAWQGVADASSAHAAIRWAERLARRVPPLGCGPQPISAQRGSSST